MDVIFIDYTFDFLVRRLDNQFDARVDTSDLELHKVNGEKPTGMAHRQRARALFLFAHYSMTPRHLVTDTHHYQWRGSNFEMLGSGCGFENHGWIAMSP